MNILQKSILLIVVAIAATSCRGIVGYAAKMIKIYNGQVSYNDNDKVNDDTIHFVINHRNCMLMKASINGVEDTVLYDSGANSSVIQFFTKETKPKGMKFYRMPVEGADKKTKVKISPIPVHIETPMCIVDHFGNAILLEQTHSCDKEPSIKSSASWVFRDLTFRLFPSISLTTGCITFMTCRRLIQPNTYL